MQGVEALSRLVVEITESGLIEEFGKALDVLARLRLRGAGVSIDDFGTGYSSMSQLRRVPCTELKIDRTFVKDMLSDESAMAMAVVEQSIGLAHRLRLRVVALVSVARGAAMFPSVSSFVDASAAIVLLHGSNTVFLTRRPFRWRSGKIFP